MRVGIGYDSHRLVSGRPLILGGHHIPSERGLEGHSDADAAAHALTDAILGAAGIGNIGELFPDTDPTWKNADSLAMLRTAHQRVQERGYRAVQADLTIILEGPKLGPAIPAIRRGLAEALDLPADAVSVKPKTNEGMGFIGRGEGIAVFAVASLEEY